MMHYLTDAQVDSIIVKPVPSHLSPVTIDRQDAPSVMSDFLWQPWSMLRLSVEGVRDHAGVNSNGQGFLYDTDDVGLDQQPFTGVQVFTPIDEVGMSRDAFERLMARYFRAVVEGATTQHAPVMQEAWWPQFVADVDTIEARVRQGD